ncbi:MAG: PASTA domain-containing protein [Erysipelotrichaceae bacterium]|nr:PASTA domain-containing protein [Erysipelotrichaceae bacterium]
MSVIDFTSLTENEIKEYLKVNDIDSKYVSFEYQYDPEIKEGYVISQSAEVGSKLKDGITIVISKGYDPKEVLSVPDYREMNEETIKAFFRDYSFKDVEYLYEESEEYEPGTVIGIFFEGEFTRDNNIKVTIAQEPIGENVSTVILPDFREYSVRNVVVWCDTNGLYVAFNNVFSDVYEADTIISQSPAANSEVKQGSTISIKISNGKGVTLGNLVGNSKSAIDKYIKDNNLKVEYTYDYSRTVKKDAAITQSPEAGKTVKDGTTVYITLSKGSDLLATLNKDYVGKSLSDLEKKINEVNAQSGTSIRMVEGLKYYSNTVAAGKIAAHDSQVLATQNFTYNLSLGSFESNFSADYFNNRTRSDIESIINNANKLYASVKFNAVNGNTTTDSSLVGKAYGCSYSGSTLTCNIYQQKQIDKQLVVNGIGNDSCGSNSSCQVTLSNADGDYSGKVNVNIVYDSEYNESHAKGELKSVSPNNGEKIAEGGTITVTLYLGPEPVIILDRSYVELYGMISLGKEDSYNINSAAVRDALDNLGFKNITIVPVSSNSYSTGYIIWNHSGASLPGHSYKASENIVIAIVNELISDQ